MYQRSGLLERSAGKVVDLISPRSSFSSNLSTSIGGSSSSGSSITSTPSTAASSSSRAAALSSSGGKASGGGASSSSAGAGGCFRKWRTAVSSLPLAELEAFLEAEATELDARLAGNQKHHLLSDASQNPHCSLEAVRTLIEVYDLDPTVLDKNQQTPLFYSARVGNVALVTYLVSAGCHVNQADLNQQTPLYYAAREGHAAVVHCLAKEMADVNAADVNQETPLFWAKDRSTCMALLAAGSDPRILSKKGVTATKVSHSTAPANALRDRSDYLGLVEALFPARLHTNPELGHLISGNDLYIAFLGNSKTDVDRLVALEQEFVDDHASILDPTGLAPRKKWCETLGVVEAPSVRGNIIKRILERARSPYSEKMPPCWTLVCRHYPSATVVGYVHYSLRDAEEGAGESLRAADGQPRRKAQKLKAPAKQLQLYIGYVKVARAHKRRGVASLLLAAVPKHLMRVAEKVKKSHPDRFDELDEFNAVVKQVSLSVTAQNQAASRMYQKFGFVAAGTSEDDEKEQTEATSSSTQWTAMVRKSNDTLQSLSAAWDRHLIMHILDR